MEQAGLALRTALDLEPERIDYLHAWADHLMRTGHLAEAGVVADRMITLHPDMPIGFRMKEAIDAARRVEP